TAYRSCRLPRLLERARDTFETCAAAIVRQRPLGAVANREDVRVAGARFAIDGNAIAARNACRRGKLRIWHRADADQDHGGVGDLAITELHAGHAPIARVEASDARLEPENDALALMKALHESGDWL